MNQRYMLTLLGVLIGAGGGYLYYYYTGCKSGVCLIASNPYYSTLYGAIMGGLLFNTVK